MLALVPFWMPLCIQLSKQHSDRGRIEHNELIKIGEPLDQLLDEVVRQKFLSLIAARELHFGSQPQFSNTSGGALTKSLATLSTKLCNL